MTSLRVDLKDENRFINSIALLINIGLIAFFFILVIKGSHSFPSRAYDDIKFFLSQFQTGWIEKSGIWGRVSFLFESTDGSHPIIMGRLSTLASYYLTGEVNFKFLTLFGNLGILTLWLSLYMTTKFPYKPVIFIVVTYFLFFLNPCIFWAVGSIGYFYLIAFIYLSVYAFYRKKYVLAAVFGFLTTFSSVIGISIFLVFIFLMFLKKMLKEDLDFRARDIVVSLAIMLITGFLFFTITWEGARVADNVGQTSTLDIINSLFSMIVGQTGLMTDVLIAKSGIAIKLIAGLVTIFLLLGMTFIIWRRGESIVHPLLICAAYLFIIIALSAYLRDNVKVAFELPWPRFMYFSIALFVVTYLIGYTFFYSKFKIRMFYFLCSIIFVVLIPFRMKADIKKVNFRNNRIERAYDNLIKGDLDKNPKLYGNNTSVAREALLKAHSDGIIMLPGYNSSKENYSADILQCIQSFNTEKLFEKYTVRIDEITFQQNFNSKNMHYTCQVSSSEGNPLYCNIYIDKPFKSSVIRWIKNNGIKIVDRNYQLKEIGIIDRVPILFNEEDQIIAFPGQNGVNVFKNQSTTIRFELDDLKEIFDLSFN